MQATATVAPITNFVYFNPKTREEFEARHTYDNRNPEAHIPDGWRATEFRPPLNGERFLSYFSTVALATSDHPLDMPSIILVKE